MAVTLPVDEGEGVVEDALNFIDDESRDKEDRQLRRKRTIQIVIAIAIVIAGAFLLRFVTDSVQYGPSYAAGQHWARHELAAGFADGSVAQSSGDPDPCDDTAALDEAAEL